jgi:hypothetical protein
LSRMHSGEINLPQLLAVIHMRFCRLQQLSARALASGPAASHASGSAALRVQAIPEQEFPVSARSFRVIPISRSIHLR